MSSKTLVDISKLIVGGALVAGAVYTWSTYNQYQSCRRLTASKLNSKKMKYDIILLISGYSRKYSNNLLYQDIINILFHFYSDLNSVQHSIFIIQQNYINCINLLQNKSFKLMINEKYSNLMRPKYCFIESLNNLHLKYNKFTNSSCIVAASRNADKIQVLLHIFDTQFQVNGNHEILTITLPSPSFCYKIESIIFHENHLILGVILMNTLYFIKFNFTDWKWRNITFSDHESVPTQYQFIASHSNSIITYLNNYQSPELNGYFSLIIDEKLELITKKRNIDYVITRKCADVCYYDKLNGYLWILEQSQCEIGNKCYVKVFDLNDNNKEIKCDIIPIPFSCDCYKTKCKFKMIFVSDGILYAVVDAERKVKYERLNFRPFRRIIYFDMNKPDKRKWFLLQYIDANCHMTYIPLLHPNCL